MKALVLHKPGDLRYEPDWPEPEPRAGWAVVRVQYAGVCGSDLPRIMVNGTYRQPLICGHEFMGTVDVPAPGSMRFAAGDLVAVLPLIPCGACPACRHGEHFHCRASDFLGSRSDGGFAELCAVPESNLLPLPAGIDARAGAFIEPIAVALHAVRRAGFRKSGRALVLGAGPIGLLTGMWLRSLGAAAVVLADIRDPSLEVAAQCGFECVYHVAENRFRELGDFDYCFEAAGAAAALLQAIDKVRRQGTITVVGWEHNHTQIPQALFEMFMRKEVSLLGCWGYRIAGEKTRVLDALCSDAFSLPLLITHQVPLGTGGSLIPQVFHGETYACKVLFDLQES